MKTNAHGIAIIKHFEGLGDGCKITPGLQPYLCPAGYWTIGFGHVIKHNGRMLKGAANKALAFRLMPAITAKQADELLAEDLKHFEAGVNRLVKVRITENQFSALVSFAYNCGLDEDVDTIPEGLGDSTLLRLINKGKLQEAAVEFPKWNKSAGRVLPGLVRRREAERLLFLNQIPKL